MPHLYSSCTFFLHFILLLSSVRCQEKNGGVTDRSSTTCPDNIFQVETIDDLDLVNCDLADLSIPELRRICFLVGLDTENEVFPYLFGEQGVSITRDRNTPHKADYIIAAKECLGLKEEMEIMIEQEQELENNLLQEDPGLLAEVMSNIVTSDPQLYEKILQYMKREEPELYEELVEEAGSSTDGNFSKSILRSLSNYPDVIADFVEQTLVADPNFFNVEDDPDLPTGGLESYFQMNEDEAEDDIDEDVEALLGNANKARYGSEL